MLAGSDSTAAVLPAALPYLARSASALTTLQSVIPTRHYSRRYHQWKGTDGMPLP